MFNSLAATALALSLALQTPEPCPPKTSSCANNVCVPLGQPCPSTTEVAVASGETPAAPSEAEPGTEPGAAEAPKPRPIRPRSRRHFESAECLESVSEWQLRRLRVGFGLAIPGAAFLGPPMFALANGDLDLLPAKYKRTIGVFTVLGFAFVLAGIIAPRAMRRRVVDCGGDSCSLTLRF